MYAPRRVFFSRKVPPVIKETSLRTIAHFNIPLVNDSYNPTGVKGLVTRAEKTRLAQLVVNKSLADALEIRDAWAKERAEIGARGNVARKGRAGALLIERRAVCVVFD